jgi:hypothetical protein
MWVEAVNPQNSSEQLATVNLGTGAVTLIGYNNVSIIADIAFAPDGILYGTGDPGGLYMINTVTGAATLVAPLTGDSLFFNSMAFSPDLCHLSRRKGWQVRLDSCFRADNKTTKRYLGCKQRIQEALNDHLGIERL